MNAAQMDNRSISGTVQDTQNNRLKDVRVELTDANGTVGYFRLHQSFRTF